MTDPELVARHGWNTAAVQALNPGLKRWRDGDALVAYAVGQRWPLGPSVWVGAGEPVCAPDRLASVARAFAEHARQSGASVAWFGASERFREEWRGHELVVGSQPVWTPADWPDLLARKASIRAQINRATNKGVTVEPLPPEEATTVEAVRSAWLAGETRTPAAPLHGRDRHS